LSLFADGPSLAGWRPFPAIKYLSEFLMAGVCMRHTQWYVLGPRLAFPDFPSLRYLFSKNKT
ncbi:hypothetical protein, partial [Alcanivorax sp. HI0083]|uniref:hypothetical protein n=1 Tax=Alcanivorax sp. HI0083 TaxID=1822258 RepID=UPI001E42B46A